MNKDDRELQARIDERTKNTYHLLEKLERHMVLQNSHISKNTVRSKVNLWIVSILTVVLITRIRGLW